MNNVRYPDFNDTFQNRFKTLFEEVNGPLETPCHIWALATGDRGYGIISYKGRSYLSHRVSWTIYKGPIANGLQVMHKCDNRSCINPDHLVLGTAEDNVKDMFDKGRQPNQLGQSNNNSRLTNAQASEIKKRLKAGDTVREIATAMDLRFTIIANIKQGNSWRWLDV